MIEHLFTRPVDALAEAVQILEVSHVADDRELFAQIIVFDEFELRLRGVRIFAEVFALPNLHAVQIGILTAPERELDIAFITEDKLCFGAFGRKQVTFTVILGFLLERNEIILAELRRGRKIQRFAQQTTGEDGAGFAGLKRGGGSDGGRDRGNEAVCALRVFQGVADKVLVGFRADGDGERLLLGRRDVRTAHSRNLHLREIL